MASGAPVPPVGRLAFLDGLRGAALIFMAVNHTARWWIDGRMTSARYALIYVTLTLAAPTFLFLVGFCLPLTGGAARTTDSFEALARRLVPRGLGIVGAGYLLNVVVFPGDPLLGSGVLHTIGLAILAMVPALWLLRFAGARWLLLAAAVLGYASFVAAVPALAPLVQAHPVIGLLFFYDFPPWPWIGLVLVGLVLGWTWLGIRQESPAAGGRWLVGAAGLGAVMVVAVLVYDWWAATPLRVGMSRDIILNHHWTPRPPAALWVLGTVLLMLGASYWLLERRRWRLPWLIVLGQTALVLYFLHQVVAFTLVAGRLGWRFNTWPRYWAANVAFVALLVGCGWGWRAVRQRLRRRRPAVLAAAG
jgi:uncharacterized membrane protein